MENALGVLGGMGPLASQLFYKKIVEMTAAEKDQEHINMVILNHATMPDRTEAIFSGRTAEVNRLLLEDCKTLEGMGCKGLVAICNTAHYFLHQYQELLSIPILSMIKEAAKEMGKLHKGERVAILATDGTIQTELYQKALQEEGVHPYVPTAQTQRAVMHLIYDCVKKGLSADKASLVAIDRELKSEGCKAALTACTELSVIKSDEALDAFYADPMDILAKSAIVFMEKRLK